MSCGIGGDGEIDINAASAIMPILVVSTHLPSKRDSWLTLSMSMRALSLSILRYLRYPLFPTRLLGPLFQLHLQESNNGFTVLCILAGLVRILANDPESRF